MRLPSHDEMVEAVLVTYDRATVMQRVDGDAWYPTARRIVEEIAGRSDIDLHRIAHALAALSPRNPWRWNVMDAWAFTMAVSLGKPMPTGTTFGHNQRMAWTALSEDGQPWLSSALKVRNFVAAIMGDETAVVVDVWAMRVVTGGQITSPNSDAEYRDVCWAYTEAARILGVSPRTTQAVTWLVAQQSGIGSRRTSRHDKGWKKGTPDFLRDIIAPNEPRQLTWTGAPAS